MVPAYGRTRQLEAMLRAFAQEPAVADGSVALVVSDDVCPEHSGEIVQQLQQEMPWLDLQLHVQQTNLGMTGNIRWLHEHAQTDYVWMFGNDDRPLPGAVGHVLAALSAFEPVLLHLPHNHRNSREADWGKSKMPASTQVFPSSRELLFEYGFWLSLVSATVVRREAVQRAIADAPTDNDWASYIWYTVAGREGRCVVLPQRLLENGFAEITWVDRQQAIYTTEAVDSFDAGFALVLSELEFGRLLDNRYDNIGTDFWSPELIAPLRDALARFPSSRHMRRRLAELARRAADAEALAIVERSAVSSEDDRIAAKLVEDAEHKFAAGDLAAALQSALTATVLHPTSIVAWCDAGVISDAMGDMDAAGYFDQALRTAPGNIDALLNRASWSLKHGLNGKVLQDARAVLEQAPQSADALALTEAVAARVAARGAEHAAGVQ